MAKIYCDMDGVLVDLMSMIYWNLKRGLHMDIPDQNEIYILQNLMSKEMLKKYEKNGE